MVIRPIDTILLVSKAQQGVIVPMNLPSFDSHIPLCNLRYIDVLTFLKMWITLRKHTNLAKFWFGVPFSLKHVGFVYHTQQNSHDSHMNFCAVEYTYNLITQFPNPLVATEWAKVSHEILLHIEYIYPYALLHSVQVQVGLEVNVIPQYVSLYL